MARFVVEPAVALKWFVPEEHSRSAARLLDGGHELLAPDTMPAEAGKIITAKTRMGECSTDVGFSSWKPSGRYRFGFIRSKRSWTQLS